MGVGRNTWKAAKEKAKREGKRIRDSKPQHFMSKSFARIPAKKVNEIKPTGLSPVNGNAFTGAMAKTGGDYDKAKEMLDGMPMMGKPKEGISMRIKNRLGLGK